MIPTLGAWKGAGKTLAVFSSGSVQAQLQFFSVVEDGSTTRDLKPLFAAHFDPTIAGSKLETKSYEKICRDLGQEAAEVTFLTDNVKGMYSAILHHVRVSLSSLFYVAPYTRFVYTWSPRSLRVASVCFYMKRFRQITGSAGSALY